MTDEEIAMRRRDLLHVQTALNSKMVLIRAELNALEEACQHTGPSTDHFSSCAGHRWNWTTCDACGKTLVSIYPSEEEDADGETVGEDVS